MYQNKPQATKKYGKFEQKSKKQVEMGVQPNPQIQNIKPMQKSTQSTNQNGNEIILRIKSNKGMNRINISPAATIGQFKKELATTLNIEAKQIFLKQSFDGQKIIKPDQTNLAAIGIINNGQEVYVQIEEDLQTPVLKKTISAEKHILTSQCNHGPDAKCINCINLNKKEKEDPKEEKKKCTHGPNAKCIHCMDILIKEDDSKIITKKWNCQHGPNGKCSHCVDDQFIQNIKHISFEEFLNKKRANCKSHPPDAKCPNCLPPSAVSYKVNLKCKNHKPFPEAMCNSCMPPAAILKRQQYRHVDYCQFMNIQEISNFVNYWIQGDKMTQRLGYMYGYYAEDPDYKQGVRAIVEVIYEPPQIGDISGVAPTFDQNEANVDKIAESLGFEKVGWIFTDSNSDVFLSSKQISQAAIYQETYKTMHPCGYNVSKFLTVTVKPRKNNQQEVAPEVYMVSDDCQALQRDNIFAESNSRKFMQIREPDPNNICDVVPTVIRQGSESQKQFESDFFIVNIAHGQPKNNKFSIIKYSDFPVENRKNPQTIANLKEYYNRHQKDLDWQKYADFHLILYLANVIDIDTALLIGNAVQNEGGDLGTIDMLVKSLCGLL